MSKLYLLSSDNQYFESYLSEIRHVYLQHSKTTYLAHMSYPAGLPRPDRPFAFDGFVATLSPAEQEFVASHQLFAPGWRERVPADEMRQAWARDIQVRACRWMDNL